MSEALVCLTETFYFDSVPASECATDSLVTPTFREILPQKREATNMLVECAKRREGAHAKVSPDVPYNRDQASACGVSSGDQNESLDEFSNSSSTDSGIGSSQNSSPTHCLDNSRICLSEEIHNCMDVDVVPPQSSSDIEITTSSVETSTVEDLDSLRLSDTQLQDSLKTQKSSVIKSPFKNSPPLIYFSTKNEDVAPLPESTVKLLKWKLSTITPVVIKEIVTKAGFSLVEADTTEEWLGTWGKHLKCSTYKKIQHFQKVNHFPGGFHLGRKDRLWQNYRRMASKHPGAYDFFPETFLLPAEMGRLKEAWDGEERGTCWIVKPCASARGCGVRVVQRWSQVPKAKPVVVQRYLSDPYLIEGSKFDLRVYAMVPSVEPLRVYVYGDGLVRFASQKYSMSSESVSNRFVHLTNYSINRKSASYAANDDETACQGHKWSLRAFWRHLSEECGADVGALQSRITDLVIKTLLCCESPLVRLTRAHAHHCPKACFELFGFDVMLDSRLTPWLIEVNISPSLHTKSVLDSNVKGPMVRDMLNLAGFPVPGWDPPSRPPLTPEERRKHAECTYAMPEQHPSLLSRLTADDVRCLRDSEWELQRAGGFRRVFPTRATRPYLSLLEHPRYYTGLLQAWEERKAGGEGLKLLEEMEEKFGSSTQASSHGVGEQA